MNYELDDPRLTAYALGELDDTEKAEVEAFLNENGAAHDEVARIREAAQWLSAELGAETPRGAVGTGTGPHLGPGEDGQAGPQGSLGTLGDCGRRTHDSWIHGVHGRAADDKTGWRSCQPLYVLDGRFREGEPRKSQAVGPITADLVSETDAGCY